MTASTSCEQFHTIAIRTDLPKIEKQYHSGEPMDLPEPDYWINDLSTYLENGERSYSIESSRFEIQHAISNGPCEFFDNFKLWESILMDSTVISIFLSKFSADFMFLSTADMSLLSIF